MGDYSQIDLYEFLTEAELQQYYNAIKNELKITNATQFKYATDEDLKSIGMSRPEIRRLRKFYEKYFPHGYLSKIKRLLQAPAAIVKRDDNCASGMQTSMHALGSMTASSNSSKGQNSPNKSPNNKHIIPADAISVNKQLGTGEFGIVQQGVWTNGTERIQVAIKCLCRERMQSNPMEFLKEAAIMHSIEHENIVRLYGVVLATDSLMLVTELAHLRSLLECLKDPGLRVSFLTVPTLCEFALQICNGMLYLENKRLIHRDLAARNILVFSKNKVKISDFGLSRALGVGKDYYKTNFNVNLKLPIAWCAPECINYLRFTNASDVWAYGVCLWEMFSYGFQPWAALTGLQILEAIDAPNFQRLEQPDCCPRDYYTLMIKCWQDDPSKRPKFSEIYEMLPEMKPEQLKAIANCCEVKSKDYLVYRQSEIITVLDRNTGTPFWKGVLNSGKTGFFNPSNTVAFLEGLPSSNRDLFCRSVCERSSKRKLRTEMISKPQNDFKHTGHVGIDGASFGDIAFLGSSQNYNHVPRQIVTPYKPSEDIEQTPLLLPATPTSPDSLQTASSYFADDRHVTSMNPSFVSSAENTPKNFSNSRRSTFEFPDKQKADDNVNHKNTNPFSNDEIGSVITSQNKNYDIDGKDGSSAKPCEWWRSSTNTAEEPHEYHEISDDEIIPDKIDFGPSLLEEINSMFGSMSSAAGAINSKNPELDTNSNRRNDFMDVNSKVNSSKFVISSSSKKKSTGSVKPISVKDEKILNQAIEIANEISARSMIDLVSDQAPPTQSPKRKFSFRFPHLTNHAPNDKASHNGLPTSMAATNNTQTPTLSPHSKKKNFTEELKNIPDLQAIIGEEGREAYNSLIERKSALDVAACLRSGSSLLRQMGTHDCREKANAKTLPRRSKQFTNGEEFLRKVDFCDTENTLAIPPQEAPRPATLPTRGAANKVRKMGLELFADKCSGVKESESSNTMAVDKMSPCESPSYMANNFYRFPEEPSPDKSHAATAACESNPNPIPLPPREGKKHIKTNPKRHVRKYPLIIPANGVQRTLSKVVKLGNDEEGAVLKVRTEQVDVQRDNNVAANVSPGSNATTVENKNRPAKLLNDNDTTRTYQNIRKLPNSDTVTDDSASLQFERILEADSNKGNVLQSPDVTDGFYNFSIQKEQHKVKEMDHDPKIAGLYVNEDELHNLDAMNNKKLDTQTAPEDMQRSAAKVDSELAGNALFQKVRESVDKSMNNGISPDAKLDSVFGLQVPNTHPSDVTARLADSNSVSCEDLLEFSDQKPKGCERGIDSDEVRIMVKVLGKDSTPEHCLHVLKFINWDVHKGIKIIKLQNIISGAELSLSEAVEFLQRYEWDLHTTVLRLRGLRA